MSQEDIEVLRKAYELAEPRGVDGLLQFATEDSSGSATRAFPAGGRTWAKRQVRQRSLKLWIYD
jgi:hypothetical protein